MEKVGYFYHATSEQNRVSICTTNTLTPQVHNPPQGWMLLVDRSIKHLVPDGVFFCATLYNGDLPTISPYGSERVRVPISEVIRQLGGQVELYQGKGMDNRENRYVRLMMVRQGYTNPILQHMSKLDLADNEWLRSTPNGFLVARRPTWVVIYIPESINVTECLWDNASDHRKSATESGTLHTSSYILAGSLKEPDVLEIFPVAYSATLDNILNDPINDAADLDIPKFVEIAHTSVVRQFYNGLICDIYESTKSNASNPSARELLFNRLHLKRIDPNVQLQCCNLFLQVDKSLDMISINNFSQLVMIDLIGEMCKAQTAFLQKKSDQQQETISDNDQTVLFYICGYLIKSLTRRYGRCRGKPEQLQCIQSFVASGADGHGKAFLKKFENMITMKDRGGLSRPCGNFYLLVRECEIITRSLVDTNNLAHDSMLVAPLKEKIFDAFMVKHYTEKLQSGVSQDVASSVIEDVIGLFLTVRGHAVVRVERNKLSMNSKQKAKSAQGGNCKSTKKSSSLRQALKDVSTVHGH